MTKISVRMCSWPIRDRLLLKLKPRRPIFYWCKKPGKKNSRILPKRSLGIFGTHATLTCRRSLWNNILMRLSRIQINSSVAAYSSPKIPIFKITKIILAWKWFWFCYFTQSSHQTKVSFHKSLALRLSVMWWWWSKNHNVRCTRFNERCVMPHKAEK